MVYRIKPENTQNAKQGIKNSNRAGFAVTDVESRPTYQQDRNMNASRYFTDKVWMTTPYLDNNGYPLLAVCEVEHGNIRIDRSEQLEIGGVELWTVDRMTGKPDKNFEDVYENEYGTRDWTVIDRSGWEATHEDVENAVADCASATVYFPHVMHYDEYMKFQDAKCHHLGEPSADAYAKYLKTCEGLMRDMPYVGEIRDPDRVNLRQLEMPEFQRASDEYAEDVQNTAEGMEI